MRACVSPQTIDANQAWQQLLEKRYDLATLQPAADNHLAGSINAGPGSKDVPVIFPPG